MYVYFKKIMDKICAIIALVVFMPLMAVVALSIRIETPGKAIIKQTRIGKSEKPVEFYKFRSMVSENIHFDVQNPVISDSNQNVTKVGRVIRKLKIDELPQLVNIIKGDMSFIGPRPLLRDYVSEYEPWELEKFKIAPGLSGLAQIKGNGHLTREERSYYDIVYSDKMCLVLDIKILLRTLVLVVIGEEKFLQKVDRQDLDSLIRSIESKKLD